MDGTADVQLLLMLKRLHFRQRELLPVAADPGEQPVRSVHRLTPLNAGLVIDSGQGDRGKLLLAEFLKRSAVA
ncbi:hypothetical protein D3C75_1253680 [compost metagenome]